jgi:hypothetical protein
MRGYVWSDGTSMITFPYTLSQQYIGITKLGSTEFHLLRNIHQDKWGFTAVGDGIGDITMKENVLKISDRPMYVLVRHGRYHNQLGMIEGTFKSLPTPHQPAGTLVVVRRHRLYDVSFGNGANITSVDGAVAVADNHSIQFFKDGKVVFSMQKLADEYGYSTAYQRYSTGIGNVTLNMQKADYQPAHKQIFELA